MTRKYLFALAAACALLALGIGSVGQASAAEIRDEGVKAPLLAIYGEPAANAAQPIGGGLGRNFGFGENILFEACSSAATICSRKTGENLSLTVGGVPLVAGDTYVGGTLQSNKTPEFERGGVKHESPLGFTLQFSDFQDSTAGGALTAAYSDTSDRPWIVTICGSKATCQVGPREGEEKAFLVKVEDVSFNVGPGVVVQGTVWGEWVNSRKAGEPACIKLLEKPPANAQTTFENLYETQGANVGAAAEKIKGEVCVISANNNYYGTEAATQHQIVIE